MLSTIDEILMFANNCPKDDAMHDEKWLRDKNSGGESFDSLISKFKFGVLKHAASLD